MRTVKYFCNSVKIIEDQLFLAKIWLQYNKKNIKTKMNETKKTPKV